jgi:hypothetical protein
VNPPASSSSTSTTRPPGILPPITIPGLGNTPLASVLSFLGSGGTAAPAQAAYGLDPAPSTPAHHHGMFSSFAHWSRSLLEKLW